MRVEFLYREIKSKQVPEQGRESGKGNINYDYNPPGKYAQIANKSSDKSNHLILVLLFQWT